MPTSFVFDTKNAVIVFDLNGHNYTRFSYYNYHFNASYDSATDTWSKGSAIDENDPRGKTSGNEGSAFSMGASAINFTLKTSVSGSNIYTYTLYRDLWLDENGNTAGYDNVRDLIGRDNNNNGGVTFINYKGATNSVVNIEGDGITYYGASFVTNEYGTNRNSCTFNVNGGTYHVMLKTYMSLFSFQAGGTVDIRNATIYANGSSFVRAEDKVGSNGGSPVTVVDFTFTNCKIFDSYATNNNTAVGAAGIKLVDCLYYASKNDSANLTIDSLTYTNYNALSSMLATGTATVQIEKAVSVNGIAESGFVLDENHYPTFSFTEATKEYTFTYAISDIDTDCVTVNWYDVDGYRLESTYALKNDTLVIPVIKVPIGDGWRAVTNVTTWTYADGTVFDLYIGEDAEYDLFPILPDEADREYASYVTEAMFNMVYFTNFAYNVYVPKVDGVKIVKIGGEAPSKTVWIKNVEYWAYTTYAPSTSGLEDTEISLEYIIEGKTLTAKFRPSAIFYANTIVSDPYAEADEKDTQKKGGPSCTDA